MCVGVIGKNARGKVRQDLKNVLATSRQEWRDCIWA